MISDKTALDDLKIVLKNKGMKYTEQRAIILQILLNIDEHLNAEEIHSQVKEKFPELNIGIATIYRTLNFLEEQDIHWGVVTNKPAFLTDPLLQQLGLYERACSVISGDTIAQRKPDPAPMYLAADQCSCLATECVYVGDAQRDIEAGNRANMRTLIASYGYIDAEQTPKTWGANGVVEHPLEILDWLESGVQTIKS